MYLGQTNVAQEDLTGFMAAASKFQIKGLSEDKVHRSVLSILPGYCHVPRYKNNLKLDGVGPVDNRPSTDELHHFITYFFFFHVTCDMGHMTFDM